MQNSIETRGNLCTELGPSVHRQRILFIFISDEYEHHCIATAQCTGRYRFLQKCANACSAAFLNREHIKG